MKRLRYALLFSALCALHLAADEGYKFHVSMTTVAGGLRAIKPDHPALSGTPDERLQEPAMLFEKREAARGWRATFMNCPKQQGMLGCEVRINAQAAGSAARDAELKSVEQQKFDLGFSANAGGTVRTRCLRPSCTICVDSEPKVVLGFGDSRDIPFDVDIEVTFP